MEPGGHYEEIPDSQRRTDVTIVAIIFSIMVGVSLIFALNSAGKDAGIAYGAAIVFALIGTLLGFNVYRKRQIHIPAPFKPRVISEDEIAAQAESAERWKRIEKKWWYRYPFAGLMFFGAWFLVETKPGLWWLAAVLAIYGLVLAKELGYLALFGLACLLGYWLLQGIASIPVSVAVIIGALIIASAVRK